MISSQMPRILKRLLWWSSNDQIGQVCSKASSDFSLTPKNFFKVLKLFRRCYGGAVCMETFTKHSACRHFSVLALFWPSTTMDLYIYMWPDSVYVWLLTGWEKRFKAFIKSLDYARKILCDFPNAWQIIEGALKLDNLVLNKKKLVRWRFG